MLAGRPHEAVGNGSPRWMTVAPRKRGHRTRPTGRLTPFHPPDLRLMVAGGRPLHIRCTCAGRGCIRGLSAGRGESAGEGGTGPCAGLRDEVPVEVDRRGDRLVAEPAGHLRDRHAPGQGGAGERVPLMRNSALAALCGRLVYAPCRDVSAGRGGGARVAVRIILLGLGSAAQRVELGGVAVSAAGRIDRSGEESPCSLRLRTGVIVMGEADLRGAAGVVVTALRGREIRGHDSALPGCAGPVRGLPGRPRPEQRGRPGVRGFHRRPDRGLAWSTAGAGRGQGCQRGSSAGGPDGGRAGRPGGRNRPAGHRGEGRLPCPVPAAAGRLCCLVPCSRQRGGDPGRQGQGGQPVPGLPGRDRRRPGCPERAGRVGFLLRQRGLRRKTVAGLRSALADFLDFLAAAGRAPQGLAGRLPPHRHLRHESEPHLWTAEEIRRLLAVIDRQSAVGNSTTR